MTTPDYENESVTTTIDRYTGMVERLSIENDEARELLLSARFLLQKRTFGQCANEIAAEIDQAFEKWDG